VKAHVWIVPIPYVLTEGQAAAAQNGARLTLDIGKVHPDFYDRAGRVKAAIGCYVCEQPYEEARGKPCPGEPGS